jgi:cell division protein FtsI/penicillin-binding protein 2
LSEFAKMRLKQLERKRLELKRQVRELDPIQRQDKINKMDREILKYQLKGHLTPEDQRRVHDLIKESSQLHYDKEKRRFDPAQAFEAHLNLLKELSDTEAEISKLKSAGSRE